MLELDHVLIAVGDLDAAAQEFETLYGLESIEGGRHPGLGTMNRIVPLGDAYLELVSVIEAREAAASVFGRWVARSAAAGGHLLGWAVRTDHLESLCRRLDLTPLPGSRLGRDAKPIRWRTAGIERAAAEPSLPFFIEWEPGGILPGRSAVREPAAITEVAIRGDELRLSSWLGDNILPASVTPGSPAVVSVTVDGPRGRVIVDH